MQSEILTLERRQVDLEAKTVRLEPGTTKNEEGRLVYLTPELTEFLRAQLHRVDELGWRLNRVIAFVFPHLQGRYEGRRIKNFTKAWKSACEKAGCSEMLLHDFRRTAVRNMVNVGIPERVAMTVTGHRTRSVFDRYHVVNPTDLQRVAQKLAGTTWAQHAQSKVDSSPPSMQFSQNKQALPF